VEDAFDITLDEKDMEEMQTVTDAIKIVALKTAL
jgi:acyl carrier protein